MFSSQGDAVFGQHLPSMAGPHLRQPERSEPAPSRTLAKGDKKGKARKQKKGKKGGRGGPRHIEFLNDSFSSSSFTSEDSITDSSSFDDESSSESYSEQSFQDEAERESLVHPPQHTYGHRRELARNDPYHQHAPDNHVNKIEPANAYY